MERSILRRDHLNHKCAIQMAKFHNRLLLCISKHLEFLNRRTDMNCNKKKHSNNALQGLSKNRKLHRDHLLAIRVYASKTPIITIDSKTSIWVGHSQDRQMSDRVHISNIVKAKVTCTQLCKTVKMKTSLKAENSRVIRQWRAFSALKAVKQTLQIDY